MFVVNVVCASPCSQSKSCFVLIFCYQKLVDNKVADGIRPHLLIMICCLRVAAGDISQCDHQHKLEHINHLISLVPRPSIVICRGAWIRRPGDEATIQCMRVCVPFVLCFVPNYYLLLLCHNHHLFLLPTSSSSSSSSLLSGVHVGL